jgi:hypothetical protein
VGRGLSVPCDRRFARTKWAIARLTDLLAAADDRE